jgi:hypothetical protein
MKTVTLFATVFTGLLLAACGGGGGGNGGGIIFTSPDAPTAVKVAVGATSTIASVSFTAPVSGGTTAITGYTVTANPGGITATGTTSPITLTGLTPQTAYTYSVVATNSVGNSAPATTGLLNFYSVVETFHEPMTQPNDSIFTGTFTFDATSKTVSNLKGSLTQSMTMMGPMTTVPLTNQLSAVPATLGGVDGLLVTTFTLTTTNTFSGGGFAPGGTQYYDLLGGIPNNHNAYAMIFVNTTNPTTAVTQAQIDKLAYADCTPGGMMGTTCMTGTTMAGYGRMGTMMGEPVSQMITKL